MCTCTFVIVGTCVLMLAENIYVGVCVCVCARADQQLSGGAVNPSVVLKYLAVLEDTSPTETDNEETQEEVAGETCALFIPVNKRITKRMLP